MTLQDAIEEARENELNNQTTEPCVIRHLLRGIETLQREKEDREKEALEDNAFSIRRRLGGPFGTR